MTTNTDKLAARTFDELTEAERVSAITAFKRAHGSMAELNFAPDRAWIEGFAYAQSLEAAGRVQQADAPSGVGGWKEAAIAWEACASIHRQWAKGKDALFTTRQADFQRHADDARAALASTPAAKEQKT